MAKASFKELINGNTPVLVDFYAEWCGPCKMMAPELEKIAKNLGDKVKIIKIDVDHNQALANSYQVRGVPTLVLFSKGRVLWRQSGAMYASQLMKVLAQHVPTT